MCLKIYFIRHGETEWSLSGRHTGYTDIPLTNNGEKEAHALMPCLRRVSFAHILSSPMLRARQTCALAGLGETPEIVPELAEWNYGDYEAQRTRDIRVKQPGWNIFQDGCPNGESPAQISSRADQLIIRLDSLEGNIALFSHGQFGSVLVARWIGLVAAEGQHLMLGPASVSILCYNPSHPGVRVIAL